MKRLFIVLIVLAGTFTSFVPKMVFADTPAPTPAPGIPTTPTALPAAGSCNCFCEDKTGTITNTKQVGTASDCTSTCTFAPYVKQSHCDPLPASATAPAVPPATCSCYCATSNGATLMGTDKMSVVACQAACQKTEDQKMVVCSFTGSDTPDTNPFCFTEAQCAVGDKNLDTGEPAPGTFSTQAHECPKGQAYCFPGKGTPFLLAIPFDPTLPTVVDLGDYINKAYQWMIGAGLTIAIVMMIIGGFQYVLAAGGGSVEKGKKRIMNGLIGFVLLLCVNLILLTINPFLRKLEIPKLPLTRQLGLATVTSCEDMIAKQDSKGNALYVLDPPGTKDGRCGNDPVKVSAAVGQPGIASGTTCSYQKCNDPLARCIAGKCLTCNGVNESNSPVKPSPQLCGLLAPIQSTTPNSAVMGCYWKPNTSLITALTTNNQVAEALATDGICLLQDAQIHASNEAIAKYLQKSNP